MFCDILTPERTPYEGDPRHILRRALRRSAEMGFDTFNVGPELEYFLFRDASGDRAARHRRLFRPDHARRGLRRAPRDLDRAGGARHPCRVQHHEVGPSQHEIDIRYADALKMADDCMTYRITSRRSRSSTAGNATFMPKPCSARTGRECTRTSPLFAGGRNAFFDADETSTSRASARRSSRPAAPCARDLLDLRQWVNSYKRLVPGYERRSTSHGRAATARRSSACRSTTPARPRRRGWSCAARTPPATPTSPSPRYSRPARGHRARLRAAGSDGAQPLPPQPRGAAPPRHRAAPGDARRRDRADG